MNCGTAFVPWRKREIRDYHYPCYEFREIRQSPSFPSHSPFLLTLGNTMVYA